MTGAELRDDLVALARKLAPSLVRYTGGNVVSAHRCEDGIGPCEESFVRLHVTWRSREFTALGIHEFTGWCDLVGVRPMLALETEAGGSTATLLLPCWQMIWLAA